MATKKKAAKAKPAPKKAVKKSASKPAKKTVKPAPKKVVYSHSFVNKTEKKSTSGTSKKAVAKKVAKPAKKAIVKKTTAKKPVIKKVIAKPSKKVVTKAIAKPVIGKNHVSKPSPVKAVAKASKPKKPVPAPREVVKPVQVVPRQSFTIKLPKAQTPQKYMNVENTSQTDDRSRYSDAELKEFKVLVLHKLEEAREELVNLNAAVINANENGTDDTGASFKMLEDGSDTLAKEESAQLAIRQKKFIDQLEAALQRIENKTYGICRVTGKLIAKERLRAVPHTTQSMEAKLKQYRD